MINLVYYFVKFMTILYLLWFSFLCYLNQKHINWVCSIFLIILYLLFFFNNLHNCWKLICHVQKLKLIFLAKQIKLLLKFNKTFLFFFAFSFTLIFFVVVKFVIVFTLSSSFLLKSGYLYMYLFLKVFHCSEICKNSIKLLNISSRYLFF